MTFRNDRHREHRDDEGHETSSGHVYLTDEARQALQELAAENRLMPTEVVETAKAEDSPLHPFFEWDDSLAAHRYRLDCARSLIRRVRVEIVTETTTICCPRYVHDVEAETEGYVTIEDVRKSTVERRSATALSELRRGVGNCLRAATVMQAIGYEREAASVLRAVASLEKIARGFE